MSSDTPDNAPEILKKLHTLTAKLPPDTPDSALDEDALKRRLCEDSGGDITLPMLVQFHLVKAKFDEGDLTIVKIVGDAIVFRGQINRGEWCGSSLGWIFKLETGQVIVNAVNYTDPEIDHLQITFSKGAKRVAEYYGTKVHDVSGSAHTTGTGSGQLF